MKAKDLFEDAMPDPEGQPDPGQKQELSLVDIMRVIPRPVRRRVVALLKKHYPDYGGEISRLLKAELRTVARELESVGLLPDYAAYAIPYFVYTNVPSADDIDSLNLGPDTAAN